MIGNRASLDAALDRIATGLIFEHDVSLLRSAVAALDEMDDLVDAVCSCRTQEIPIIRAAALSRRDDDHGGNRP